MKMKLGMRSLTVAVFLAVLGLAPVARAEDGVIPMDKVPKAVMSAAKARFPGAEIREASEETEDEKPIYSLEMKHQRRNLGVSFHGDGTVVLVKTAVPRKELPKVLLRAVASQYPGASLRGANSVRKGPELKKAADYYELYLLTDANRPRLVKVDPKGKVLEDPFRRLRRAHPRPAVGLSRGPVSR
jgi:hypothetical protein